MATTTPDNVRSPNPTDPYNLVADLAILASDVQTALTRRANLYVGTAAQRTAFTTAPDGVHWQDTNSNRWEWIRTGGAWVVVDPTASGVATGLTITQGVATSQTVTFPAGLFTTAPHVTLTPRSPASRIRDCVVYPSGESATGFTLNPFGTGSTSYTGWTCGWLAVKTNN